MSSCSDQDIVEAYREGSSLSRVADRYGVSRSRVYRTILRLAPGIVRRKGPSRRTSPSERDLEIVEAYREGSSLSQVADRYGVSWRTVYRTIRAVAPWVLRQQGAPRQPDPNERDRRILESRRAGMTLAEIGELEGISHQRVHVVLKRWRWKATGRSQICGKKMRNGGGSAADAAPGGPGATAPPSVTARPSAAGEDT